MRSILSTNKMSEVSYGFVVVLTLIELKHGNKFMFFYYHLLIMKFQQ